MLQKLLFWKLSQPFIILPRKSKGICWAPQLTADQLLIAMGGNGYLQCVSYPYLILDSYVVVSIC